MRSNRMTLSEEFVNSVSADNLVQIINDFESFRQRGILSENCRLRQYAEEFATKVYLDNMAVVRAAENLAFEAYRKLALRSLNLK